MPAYYLLPDNLKALCTDWGCGGDNRTGIELAHGLWSATPKDTVLRQNQSQELPDSATMHYCEGAEQRDHKEISGKMSHRFWKRKEEAKAEVFPEVLK